MPPRKALSLEDRVRVIKLVDGGKSCRKVAEELGVGKTQVQSIMKRKAEFLEDYENNMPGERKRKVRKTGNEDINQLCWKWFQDALSRCIPVSGPLIKEKALQFARELGNEDFKASNGWLDSFVKRNNIAFGIMSGESGCVNNSVVDEWKEKLPELCEGYDPENIFNMDETGLFFRATTAKTWHVKGDGCKGGKQSKERLTLAVCSSMAGEKMPLLVIGKSANPRCFKNVKTKNLPVDYKNNKKAWMTGYLFENWLKSFDRKMKKQKRKVLLFLDNATSHSHLNLTNVKLQFFPANTTSKVQPMDQGIIQAIKLKYRKRQLNHLLSRMEMDKTSTGPELLKQITILDAIYWASKSWEDVEKSTVEKCFKHCGFVVPEPAVSVCEEDDSDSESTDSDDDIPLAAMKLSQDLFGVTFQELVEIDNDLATCDTSMTDWDKPAQELLAADKAEESEEEEETGDQDSVNEATCSVSQAHECIEKLKAFALRTGKVDMLTSVMSLNEQLAAFSVQSAVKQTVISDFFAGN